MNLADARTAVARILDASLDELTDTGRLSILPQVRREDWDLRDGDRDALWSYGLPPVGTDELMAVVGGFQEDRHPELEHDGSRLYLLGTFGTARLAAAQASGRVLAMPKYREVHPQLRHLYPSGITPTVVNSTVANLVDAAWRWHWLVSLLAEQGVQAVQAEVKAMRGAALVRARHELPDFYAPYQELCKEVLKRFEARDPVIGPEADFWSSVIVDVW